MTRQYQWQLKMLAEDKCVICSEPAVSKYYCKAHTEYHRQKGFEFRRNKLGIPLDAPLSNRGRKRVC